MAVLTVGIVGLGRIGAGFDEPNGKSVRTHLKACLRDRRFRVAMLADADADRARREAERFNVDAKVTDVDELLRTRLDVVAIATPDETHLPFAARAVEAGGRAIVIEKPIGGTHAERHDLLRRASAQSVMLVANYPRRFLPKVAGWLDAARRGEFGQPISARIRYGRGFRHNAIHGLDLIVGCMDGKVRKACRFGAEFDDYSAADRTITLGAEMIVGKRAVPLWVNGVDGRMQTVFEVELVFERGRMLLVDEDGIRAHFFSPVELSGGFAAELRHIGEITDDPPCLMQKLWGTVGDVLLGGRPTMATATSGFAADDLADQLLVASAKA